VSFITFVVLRRLDEVVMSVGGIGELFYSRMRRYEMKDWSWHIQRRLEVFINASLGIS
jgi:hypothetical protein